MHAGPDRPEIRTIPASLHVLASNDRRGAEVFGTDLAEALVDRGAQARAVALSQSANAVHLAVPSLADRFGLRVLPALRRQLRGVDVVVGHGSTSLPALALSTPGGPPFVYRSIGDPRHWSASGVRKLRSGVFLRRAAAVVVLWPVIADVLHQMHGIPHDRIHVIPNAVDSRRFPVVDADRRREARRLLGLAEAPTVSAIGALSEEKDLGTAIRAVARLDDVVLVLAGDGPRRDALEALARAELPLERVRFLGPVSDPAQVLAASDAVVLSSRTEGLPGVLIEAGLSGLPAVTTAVGGVREIVVDGETGFVVSPGDVDALADGLGRVVADPGRLGENARARCLERFDLPVVVDRWVEVLAALA